MAILGLSVPMAGPASVGEPPSMTVGPEVANERICHEDGDQVGYGEAVQVHNEYTGRVAARLAQKRREGEIR